jgi:hypothetical protein
MELIDLETLKYWDPRDMEPRKTPTEMVKEYAKVSGQAPDVKLYSRLIDEEFGEWGDETWRAMGINISGEDYNPAAELKELADLLYVIYGYANARGWDVEEALKRVHENNMGRMYQPDGTIQRRADGKIEKNKDYPKVDLTDLIK